MDMTAFHIHIVATICSAFKHPLLFEMVPKADDALICKAEARTYLYLECYVFHNT